MTRLALWFSVTGRLARALPLLAALSLGIGCSGSIEDRLASARQAQEVGDFADSVDDLRQVLAEEPDHPEANYLLGMALLRTGQGSPAVWPLRKAAESDAYALEAGLLLAQTLFSTRNPEEAAQVAQRVIERNPDNVDAWRTLVRAQGAAHQYKDAEVSANRLLELKPNDAEALVLRAAAQLGIPRYRDSEQSFDLARKAATAEGNLTLAAQACATQARVRAERLEDPAGGKQLFGECLRESPTDPTLVSTAAQYYTAIGDAARAEAIWRTAIEQAPDSLGFHVGLAQQLAASGKVSEAQTVLEEAAQDFSSLEAWIALAEMFRAQGDLAKAEATLDRAGTQVGDSDALRFRRVDLLVELDRVEEAQALAAKIEDPSYRDAARGRALQKLGKPAEALEALEASLLRWPNNAPARFLAGRAAEDLGQYDRAIEEYKQAIRADIHGTDAGLVAAYLSYSLGRFADALEFAGLHVRGRPYHNPEPYVIAVRAAQAAGRDGVAQQWLAALEKFPGGKPTAIAERAKHTAAKSGPAEAVKQIQQSGIDVSAAGNEILLRALIDAELQQGRGEPALAALERALAARPDSPELLDLRGRTLTHLGRSDEARAAFEKAIAANPAYTPALEGLGLLALRRGELDKALELFERAATNDPDDPESAYRVAQVWLAKGDPAEAERRLNALVTRVPGHVGAANDLAFLLAQSGRDLDRALELAQRAVRLEDKPEIRDTLATVQLARGETDAALETLDAALEKHPDAATLRFRKGEALARKGDGAGAREAYRRALEGGPFPEAEQARAALAKLEGGGAVR